MGGMEIKNGPSADASDDLAQISASVVRASRHVCLVALAEPMPITTSGLAAHIAVMFPEKAQLLRVGPDEPDDAGLAAIIFDSIMITAALLPFPIPAETIEPALGNALFWPGAREGFSTSTAHLLFMARVLDQSTSNDIDIADALTLSVAAMAAQSQHVTGIYWSAAENVVAPQQFVSEATSLALGRMPTGIWLNFVFFKSDQYALDQSIVCRTVGLMSFIDRELESAPMSVEPGDIATLLRDLAVGILRGCKENASAGGWQTSLGRSLTHFYAVARPDLFEERTSAYGDDHMPVVIVDLTGIQT